MKKYIRQLFAFKLMSPGMRKGVNTNLKLS